MIDLYTWPTPNGYKVHIMLEEIGLPYNVHAIDIGAGDQFKPDFLKISPNNKMPAMVDPDGPDGQPISMFESGAILMYLGEKTGKFMPTEARKRYQVLQWLMFQMGGLGPMFGQLGFFYKFAGAQFEDKRPQQRYIDEAKRLLGVLETALDGKEWIAGDYSIADIAIWAWYGQLVLGRLYNAAEFLDVQSYKNVMRWAKAIDARPAVQRGRMVNRTFGEPEMQLHERHDAADFDTQTQDKIGTKE